MSSAGKWRIDVTDPYPAWCRIFYEDRMVASVHHNELRDLRYAADQAMREAKIKLKRARPGDEKEV